MGVLSEEVRLLWHCIAVYNCFDKMTAYSEQKVFGLLWDLYWKERGVMQDLA